MLGFPAWPTRAVTWAIVTINKPAQELYDFWRDLTNLPQVMENIESITVLKGSVGFFVFEPNGDVQSLHRLEAGDPASCLVDIEPGVWHTFVPLADDTVVLEIKRGPYNAAIDKTFAAWAPGEGSAAALGYLRQLEALFEPKAMR